MGALHFTNQRSRNDWLWVHAGFEEIYGAPRGLLPAKVVVLFEIRDYTCENAVGRVAAIRMFVAVN